MGYSKCAVPSCSSRAGQGKLFKYFPKAESQRRAWLQVLPSWVHIDLSKENVSRQVAFCEDHFKAADIEPGAYGKRTLNSRAVPSVFTRPSQQVSPRKPFGDVGNVMQSIIATPPRKHSSKIVASTPKTSAAVPLVFSRPSPQASPRKPLCENIIATPPRKPSIIIVASTPKSPPRNSTFKLDCMDWTDPLMPDEVTESTTSFILDEETGLFVERPSLENIDHDHIFLCDQSGAVRPYFPKEQIQSYSTFAEQQSILESMVDALENTIEMQAVTVAELREENDLRMETINQQKRKIEELEGNVVFFSSKCKSLCRSTQRLEQKLASFGWPWLTPDQVKRLARKHRGGVGWTPEEIRVGLILKMKSGSSAYTDWVSRFPILPSLRSLQESVQFIRFEPGVLHSMFDLLEGLVPKLPDWEKDCQIVLDEMAIEEGPRYDASLRMEVGNATLKSHEGRAKKALVFILAGISRRWKISVHMEFTSQKIKNTTDSGKNPTGEAYKDIVDSIVMKAEHIGLYVCSVTSDMGPDNMGMWRAYGVSTGRTGQVKNSFRNPVREGMDVTIIPDAVHLWKAVKATMEKNEIIRLPADIVKEEKLTSDVVNYKHIEDLMEFESENELKIAFRLKEDNLHCKKHFNKMNVATTTAVIGHRTGVGLKIMSQETSNGDYMTTSWFINFLNTFFTLATGRHRGLAISKRNTACYNRFVNLIKKMSHIFAQMKVGDKGDFKPVQRGMTVLCAGYLKLINYFLEVRGYPYLMLGRFTGDCIENIFSMVRFSQPIPHAAMFLQALKVITLAQFSQVVKGSSYDHEESSPVCGDFLEEARKKAAERATERFFGSLEELMEHPIEPLTEADYAMLGDLEKAVVYDMAGSVIQSILESNLRVCENCLYAVKWQEKEDLHPAAFVTETKEFTLLRSEEGLKRKLQIYVSDAVFKAILTSEITFRMYRAVALKFKKADAKQYFVESLMFVWNGTAVPECHYIGRRILQYFFDARIQQYEKKLKEEMKKQEELKRSSRSAAMRQTVNQVTSTVWTVWMS